MSELSELVNAGRTDVIPGFVLSKPRLVEIGQAESEFARRYLEVLSKSCAALPPAVARDVMLKAADDIKYGEFSWGSSVFQVHLLARSSLPLLTLLCARVKHGDDKVTAELVAQWYETLDGDKIATAVWQLWGVGTSITKKNADGESAGKSGQASSEAPPAPPPPDSDSPPNSSST